VAVPPDVERPKRWNGRNATGGIHRQIGLVIFREAFPRGSEGKGDRRHVRPLRCAFRDTHARPRLRERCVPGAAIA
jgi:hypothetical protein